MADGSIEIYYTREFMKEYEGPFLKEERDLISNLSKLITGLYQQHYSAGIPAFL